MIGTPLPAVTGAHHYPHPVDRLYRRRGWLTDNGHWIPPYIRYCVRTAPLFPTLCPPTTRWIQTPWQAQSYSPTKCQLAGSRRGPYSPTTSNSAGHPDAYCLAKSNRSNRLCALHVGPDGDHELSAPLALCRNIMRPIQPCPPGAGRHENRGTVQRGPTRPSDHPPMVSNRVLRYTAAT